MKRIIKCEHCGKNFTCRGNVKNQCYCSDKECQRARKRKWQRDKMATDQDYRDNQKAAQKAWNEEHPDYHRQYRLKNPERVQRNRELQRLRDQKRRRLAKMDASTPENVMKSGIYQIINTSCDLAKMDASMPVFHIIPVVCGHPGNSCKKGQAGLGGG